MTFCDEKRENLLSTCAFTADRGSLLVADRPQHGSIVEVHEHRHHFGPVLFVERPTHGQFERGEVLTGIDRQAR